MRRTGIARAAFFALCVFSAAALAAQTIDKPAATVKLTKQEIFSVRQYKTEIERLESVVGKKFDDETKRQFLEGQINSMLFRQYCDREKILVAEAEINASLAQFKSQLGPNATDAQLVAAFRSQGVLVEPRDFVRQQLLFQRYVQAKKPEELKTLQTPPSADEVLKTYELMKSQLIRPDTVRVSVLYIEYGAMSEAEKKKAMETMSGIAAQLRSNPGKFDEYLIKGSDPKTSGFSSRASVMVTKTPQAQSIYGSSFVEAVFKLKVGEMTGLVQQPAGLEIARANEILPQKQFVLSDVIEGSQTVQDYITSLIVSRKASELMKKLEDELTAQLRKEGTVKIFEENLKG